MQTHEVLVYEATPRQALFHGAPEMYKLYGGAMGGGKTVAIVAESIALCEQYPGNRGYICRDTYAAFSRTTGLVLDDMLDKSGIVEKHNQSRQFYLMRNGSTLYYGGLGDDTRQIDRLKSMELGFFAIDEASETSEAFFLMLASRLRLKRPGIRYFGLLASNPDAGWLKTRFIDSTRPNHVFIPALPKDNPHLAEGYIAQLREVFPDDWQKRFLEGDWTAFEGLNNVFPFGALQAASAPTALAGLAQRKPRELGVDCARFGDDESVIALREGGYGRILEHTQGTNLMDLTGRIVKAIKAHKPTSVKVDADGLGAGVVDRLTELGYDVDEFHAGEKPDDVEKFANRKAEAYWAFRERLIAGTVAFPLDLVLQAQLTSCTYRVKSTGQLEITPKDEMKKRGVKSPDRAEALIIAFAPATRAPRIRRLS